MAYKRDVFLKLGGYDEELIRNQDDEFNYRAIISGNRIWMDESIKTKYFSRSKYKGLLKQYFNYGKYKVRGIQKHKKIVAIRHIVPCVFVISLIFTLSIGYLLNNL